MIEILGWLNGNFSLSERMPGYDFRAGQGGYSVASCLPPQRDFIKKAVLPRCNDLELVQVKTRCHKFRRNSACMKKIW